MSDNAGLVKAFNELPRQKMAPTSSGKVPNYWHFDLRFVPLEPPAHLLFLVQIDSRYILSKRLPLEISVNGSGLAFFPESPAEAAPEIARALLYSFVHGHNRIQISSVKSEHACAPWKLTTEEPQLARAVGHELRKLGVIEGVCTINTTTSVQVKVAQETFDGFWDQIRESVGLKKPVAAMFPPPQPIIFSNLNLRSWTGNVNDEDIEKACTYMERISSARPIKDEFDSTKLAKEVQLAIQLVNSKPEATTRLEADSGNAQSAVDYALRLQLGFGCKPSRQLCHVYLMKAATNESASNEIKAAAHSLLIEWYTRAFADNEIRSRYMHSAAYHAHQAVQMFGQATPAVLFFAKNVLDPLSKSTPDLRLQYRGVWRALDERNKQIEKETGRMQDKMERKTNRYRCANAGCPVQADVGKMLSQCAGSCDPDKKPHYCSKGCQKADWKVHKPFCKPGAPSSVPDDTAIPTFPSKHGSLSIPIQTGPNGKPVLLSSSTIGAEMLKELREQIEELAASRDGSKAPLGDFHVEMGRL